MPRLLRAVVVIAAILAAGLPANTGTTDPSEAAEGCFRQGVLLLKSGKREEAIEQFNQATRLRSDFANAWYNLGESCAATGDLDKAIESLKAFLELVPAGSRADYAREHLKYFEKMSLKMRSGSKASDYFSELRSDELFRWPAEKSCLKVLIIPGDKTPGYKPEYEKELRAAFQSWSQATAGTITFAYVDDLKKADIAVGWSDDPNLCAVKNEAGDCRLKLEEGTRKIKYALILLLMNPPYSEVSPVYVWNVSLHEIGHALGINGHSSNPSDAMYFFWFPDNRRHTLSERDINTVRRLYARGDRSD
jgi:predicted Zn-dependent protease